MPTSLVSRLKSIFIPILIIILSIIIFMYFSKTKPVQPLVEVKEKIWLVEVQSAEFEHLSPMQTLYGKVESRSMVHATAPISGVIEHVWVKEGQVITKGEPLVNISLADLEIPLQQAKADVADALGQVSLQQLANKANTKRLAYERKVLALKKASVMRTKQLFKRDLASQSDLDSVKEVSVRQTLAVVGSELAVDENQLKVAQNKARLTKTKAVLALAHLNMQRGQLVAPYNIRIAKVPVSEGANVSMGATLISFYGLDSLELRAKLPTTALLNVKTALNLGIELDAFYLQEGIKTRLKLSRLAGEATTSGLDAFFALPTSLKDKRPGNLMTVNLQGQRISSVIAVPYRAIYGQNKVYLVEKGRLQPHLVKIVGDVLRHGNLWALILPDFVEGSSILITHLPNAVTGLKVSEVTP